MIKDRNIKNACVCGVLWWLLNISLIIEFMWCCEVCISVPSYHEYQINARTVLLRCCVCSFVLHITAQKKIYYLLIHLLWQFLISMPFIENAFIAPFCWLTAPKMHSGVPFLVWMTRLGNWNSSSNRSIWELTREAANWKSWYTV